MTPSAPFYEFGEHFAVDLRRRARRVHHPPRRLLDPGPYESLNLGRLTADRPEDVRRNRAALKEQLGVQLAVHPPGPRHRGAPRRRTAGRADRCGRAAGVRRPGDGDAGGRADGDDRRLPAGGGGRRLGRSRCFTPAGAGLPAGSSPRASTRCASWVPRVRFGRDRAGRRSVLLRGRRGGPRRVRRSGPGHPPRSQPGPQGDRTRAAAARRRGGRARRRAVHDLRRPDAAVLASPRRRDHRTPGGCRCG